MYQLKGSAWVALLEIANQQGNAFANEWMNKLGPNEKKNFERLLPVSWYALSMDDEDNAITHLANMLFPNDPIAVRKTGRLQIKVSISRIYQLFIRIPSVEFVLKKSVQMWRSFHDTGNFKHEKISNNESIITITDYEKMPPYVRQVIWGAIEGIGELIKKDLIVILDESDQKCWKWTIKY